MPCVRWCGSQRQSSRGNVIYRVMPAAAYIAYKNHSNTCLVPEPKNQRQGRKRHIIMNGGRMVGKGAWGRGKGVVGKAGTAR